MTCVFFDRSLAISLDNDLACFLLGQLASQRLPGASLLYDARINIDLCCMLFSKQFLLSRASAHKHDWCIHVRCDSSPQFGRDYLVTQIDYVCPGVDYGQTQITKRLMPLQCVGSRSGSAAHKIEKLMFCLGLESEDVSLTAERVFSVLTDFGTESYLWFAPSNLNNDDDDCAKSTEEMFRFPSSLPLPDADHSLHHIMLAMTNFFDWEDTFRNQLSAVSRWFSIRARCDRFIHFCIYRNPAIRGLDLKRSFAALYKLTCPTLVSSRWGYIYQVLSWLLPRQQSLMHLLTDIGDDSKRDNFSDFSEKELEMIRGITDSENETSVLFWATCVLCHELACWGAKLSSFFHSCPVAGHIWEPREKPCKCQWKGRLGSVLAQGVWLNEFSEQVLNLPVTSAQHWLNKMTDQKKAWLIDQFQSCKVSIAQRFLQVFDYWNQLPYRVLSVASVLFCTGDDFPQEIIATYAKASKMYAQDILQRWRDRGCDLGASRQFTHSITRKFLDPEYHQNLRAELEWWSVSSSNQMPSRLATELMKHSSALTVMQMLEGQHHYLNMHVGGARASLPASTCALLRRRCNGDLKDKRFRHHVASFMQRIPKLLPFTFESRKDFIRHIYGFSLDMMHKDVTAVAEQLDTARLALQQAHVRETPGSGSTVALSSDLEKPLRTAHLNHRLKEGKFYRVKTRYNDQDHFLAFQCVCKHPARRSYVQRVCHLGKDVWTDCIAINLCGASSNVQALETVDCQFLV